MDLESVRCSCCGGIDITVSKNKKLGTCNHCGATVIMPRENEEVVSLLNTAYLQRANYDFDAAIKTYEFAIDKDSTEKSAYEGLLLAKYGIEYVKDPRTGRLVPTCHRTHFNSIYEDDAYLVLNELCDDEEKEVLAKKVAEIDKLQKAIVKQLEKEEDFDIFISYKATDEKGEKTEDSIIARNIYDKLTAQNYKVFFSEKTLEDRLGSDYEPIIFKAIHTAKMFILVGTKKDYVNSVWVKNEWTRFIDRIKTDDELSAQSFIPVFKEMSPYDMPKVNNKFVQGVDASKLGYDITVADGISKMLKPKEEKEVIKTFNSFENIVEFKKVQKQAKKEHHKKQIEKLKENKFKYALFLTMEILCFALPLAMIGISLTQKFPFLQYCNFWIYLSFGILWIVCFVFVLVYKGKTKLCQSILRIVLSSVCAGVAILFMILTCWNQTLYYKIWGEYPYGYAGVYSGAYYNESNGTVYHLYNAQPNRGNDFVVPEYIDGKQVKLSNFTSGKNIKNLYIDNKFIGEHIYLNSMMKVIGVMLDKVEITGEGRESLFAYVSDVKEVNINFDVNTLNLTCGNDVKVNIKNSDTINFNSGSKGSFYIDKTSNISFHNSSSCDKLSILGENDEVCVNFGQQYYENIEYQVEELIVKNNKKLTANINYNSIKDIKIDRNMQSLKLIGSMSPITIYYEGTEAEWNLIEKDIPASVTVLFNQAI